MMPEPPDTAVLMVVEKYTHPMTGVVYDVLSCGCRRREQDAENHGENFCWNGHGSVSNKLVHGGQKMHVHQRNSTKVHLSAGTRSHDIFTVCGYMFPVKNTVMTTHPVTCKKCKHKQVAPNTIDGKKLR